MYQAAKNENVEIKGSEIITGWKKVKKNLWKVEIPNSFFGSYNSFADSVYGDWFEDRDRLHHTGDLYLNGISFYEKENLDLVISSEDTKTEKTFGKGYSWYTEKNDETTTIWANFHDFNPNKALVEISVRPTCFYPQEPGINFITIRGFEISQAATQWAAPTAEQIGMVATHWNKGWIIENNIIHDTKCSGITMGKARNTGHNVWLADQRKDGSVHYIEVIFNASRDGWNKENVGSHIIRNNEIFNCEQTGICGSLGAVFSTVENNHIYDIWVKRQFDGFEIAGMKIHGGIDMVVRGNRVHNCLRGYWFDWMTQGMRITQNIMYNNALEDIYFEVNHGPYLVDNNIFLSEVGVTHHSQAGAFVHNLFAGKTRIWAEYNRYTPYHLPHSTAIAGLSQIISGDDRFYNNLFVGEGNVEKEKPGLTYNYGLSMYNDSINMAWGSEQKHKLDQNSYINNNAYLNGAIHYKSETNFIENQSSNPNIELLEKKDGIYLQITINDALLNLKTEQISSERLGQSICAKQAYENADGTSLTVDLDYLGNLRNENPKVGPFELINSGESIIKVW